MQYHEVNRECNDKIKTEIKCRLAEFHYLYLMYIGSSYWSNTDPTLARYWSNITILGMAMKWLQTCQEFVREDWFTRSSTFWTEWRTDRKSDHEQARHAIYQESLGVEPEGILRRVKGTLRKAQRVETQGPNSTGWRGGVPVDGVLPLCKLGIYGKCRKLVLRVWGGAPAEIKFVHSILYRASVKQYRLENCIKHKLI